MAVILISQWLFVITAGGDWMANGRLFSQTLPLLLAITVVAFSQILEMIGPAQSRAAMVTGRLVLINVVIFYLVTNLTYTRLTYAWQTGLQESEERALTGMAQFVNKLPNSSNAVLAATDVGRLGYFFKGRILDWWGLADEEIANTGQAQGNINPSTVLRRMPDYIVLYSNQPSLRADTMNNSMAVFSRPFFASPEFKNNYEPIKSLKFWDNRWYVLFKKKV